MLGHYGWILPLEEIDHPDVAKNGGRIYVHAGEVIENQTLAEGDIVSFYLYVDHRGLGAEDCGMEVQLGRFNVFASTTSMKATAAEFVPCPSSDSSYSESRSLDVEDCATVFEPAAFHMNPNA